MSYRRLVRRPEFEPRSDSGADLSAGWREFVLAEVGYDEVARERIARRADRRRALARFLKGLLFGLIVAALAFAATFVARSWREGRFDRYLPKREEAPTPPSPSARWVHQVPAKVTGRDTHKEFPDILVPPPRMSSADADAATPAEDDD